MCSPACVCLLQLSHHCCRHCSHLTVTPLWPDNLPRSPLQLPCSSLSLLILCLLPPPSPTTLFSLASILFCPQCFSFISPTPFSCGLFSSLAPSFAVWVFPVFRHVLCAHCAACLCLYGNPAWTGVAQRSVRH